MLISTRGLVGILGMLMVFASLLDTTFGKFEGQKILLQYDDTLNTSTVCNGVSKVVTIPIMQMDDYNREAAIYCKTPRGSPCLKGIAMCEKGKYSCMCVGQQSALSS